MRELERVDSTERFIPDQALPPIVSQLHEGESVCCVQEWDRLGARIRIGEFGYTL